MASNKKLSNGTLSLRFMQNAKTLQKLRQEPQPAKIQHEAEWTVPGYRPSTSVASASAILYESSYMPFLYESQDGSSPPVRASGRRVFKHGKELDKSEMSAKPKESNPNPVESEDKSEGDEEPSTSSSPPSQRKKIRADSKTNQAAVAAAPPKPTRQPPPQATGFLRPGGVDAPPPVTGRKLGSIAAALLEKKPKREAEDPVSIPSHAKKRKTGAA